MKYTNPPVPSSYRLHDIGHVLYNIVLHVKPKRIIEFGTLYGYSAIAMGMALHELGEGELITHDIFDAYAFKHGSKDTVRETIANLGLDKFVRVEEGNFDAWDGKGYDLVHIDISNTGDTLKKLNKKNPEGIVLFEGGSPARDRVHWMTKFNKPPMQSCGILYDVIDDRFPSLSVLGGTHGRDLRSISEGGSDEQPQGQNKRGGTRTDKKDNG